MRSELPVSELLVRALAGDNRTIGILISEIEGANPRRVVDELVGRPREAHVVGVTGPPGAGKSTLVGRLAESLMESGARVGIIAVDPTSPFTGGALLGDRVRMDWLTEDRPFMRSMATRGAVGGVAASTEDTVSLLSWLRFGYVIVETVGAGQNELAIAAIADTVVVVSVPGLGDSVQAEKAGMYEIANIHVVNKADRPGADRLADELAHITASTDGWEVPVLLTTATEGVGVDELKAKIGFHRAHLVGGGDLAKNRLKRARSRLLGAAEAEAKIAVRERLRDSDQLGRLAYEVADGSISTYQALDRVLVVRR